MTSAGARSENCIWRPHNVSPNPSPTVATRFNTSKISYAMSPSSLEFSLMQVP
jgi:hypothetical protein